jgi:DNA-binding protein WhiA
MSFSSDTKNEMTHGHTEKACCAAAEAVGFIRSCGSVFARGEAGIGVAMTTENPAVARYIKTLLADRFGASVNLTVGESEFGKGRHVYGLRVMPDKGAARILSEIGLLSGHLFGASDERVYAKKCCRRAYLRGLFLGAGTVDDPEKGYNLEIVCRDEASAYASGRLINSFAGMHARVRRRRGNAVVYLKSSEQIKDMLNIIGAHNRLLKFENAMVLKDVRNRTNRINNCDNANLDRLLGASSGQIADIDRIRGSVGLDALPGDLLDIALARLAHPEASLSELGELLDPPIGKSAAHARLRRIAAFAAGS